MESGWIWDVDEGWFRSVALGLGLAGEGTAFSGSRRAVGVGVLGSLGLEAVRFGGRAGLGRRRFGERPAQVEEVLLGD